MSSPRRHLDQYFTPAHATKELLKRACYVRGHIVLECCIGDGAIANVLKEAKPLAVYGNDIDRRLVASTYLDATQPESWRHFTRADWVISNPPFNCASEIIPLAYEHAAVGIAMLLRLSYLEPCLDRDLWLEARPPSKLIVLPRISFTNDGKTDNVTCAWFVWDKRSSEQQIIIVPREGRR